MFITHVKHNAWLRSTRSKRTKVKSGPEERLPQVVLIQTDVQCSTFLNLPIRCTLLRNTSEIGLWFVCFFSRYGNLVSMGSTESQGKRKFYQKERIVSGLATHKIGNYHQLLEFQVVLIFLWYLEGLNWISKYGFIFFLIKCDSPKKSYVFLELAYF